MKPNIASTANLVDALQKICSVKALDRSNSGTNRIVTGPGMSFAGVAFDPKVNHRDQILGFMFTSASLSRGNLLKGIQGFNRVNPRSVWPNLFCDFKHVLISYECPGGLCPSPMDAKCMYCTKESEIDDLLLMFFCILATFVDQAHVARPPFFAYASLKNTAATYHDLTGERQDE